MKKKLPLVVLEALEKFVDLKGNNFLVVNPDDCLLKIVDIDENSDFYFYVEDFKTEGGFKLLLNYKPTNNYVLQNRRAWVDGKSLSNFFKSWVELLNKYNTVKSFFDDPIINAFTEEYFSEFEIIDDDNEKPLNTNQILLLDDHLEYIENNITKFETEQNANQLQEIRNDVIILRNVLTSESKAIIIKKLSRIWAKLTKQGTTFLKEFLSEAKKQAIQKGVKYILEQAQNIIDISQGNS